jgi:superfamily II DNA or RNA helicase
MHFQHRGEWKQSTTTIQKEAEVSWTSSPLALSEVLENTIQDQYDVDFVRSTEERADVLGPILQKVQTSSYEEDEKFLTLCHYLRQSWESGEKVLVFTERHATAVYLEESLARKLPFLNVASVSKKTDSGYGLKDFDSEAFQLILDFAPEANADKIEPGHEPRRFDVLITTDAYSTGVNLQDANVVISYDLAWTPDVIIQRAGRILRLWKRPRLVRLFVFVGEFHDYQEAVRSTLLVEKRLLQLTKRSRQAERFSELPVFPEAESAEYTSLGALASVTIEQLGLADLSEIEEFTGVSRYLKHIAELRQNQVYADSIPDDISSAMAYRGSSHQLYLLLRRSGEYHWMLFDVNNSRISVPQEDQLLDLIKCSRDTPVALVDSDTIDQVSQLCKTRWENENEIPESDAIERICALYLLPEDDDPSMAKMLKSSLFS